MHWVSRSLPKGAIHVRTGLEVARRARARRRRLHDRHVRAQRARRDGSRAARTSIKLTADPAFERARRRGIVGGDVDEFQRDGSGAAVRLLRACARRGAQARGARVHARARTCASSRFRGASMPERVSVLPNPAPPLPRSAAARRAARARSGSTGPTLAFAGRLTAQKSLRVALEAVAAVDGVTLSIAGEGDERAGARARRRGARARPSACGSSVRCRASASSSSSRRPMRRSSRRAGRTSRTRSSRRSRSARRCIATATGGVARGRAGRRERPARPARRRRRRSATRSAAIFADEELRRAAARSGRAVGRGSTRRSASSRELEQTLERVARTLAR